MIDMYRRQIREIYFEANRRRQRRVFIAIHKLQEELVALSQVVNDEISLLQRYMLAIDPRKSDLAYSLRRKPYRFEEKYIDE